MNSKRNEVLLYLVQAVLVFVILAIGFDLRNWRLDVPIVCEGDALHYLAVARSILDGGYWWHIERLSAPFELPMIMFPFCGIFEFGLLKMASLIFTEPGALVNSVFFASFLLTASTSCWCLRLLGFSRVISATIGILYAFLPFAFYRNTGHLMLMYYFVPFVSTVAVLICSDTLSSLKRGCKIALYLGAILVGFNYIYTAFFGCFLLGVAGLYSYLNTRRLQGAILAGLLIVSIGCVSLINIVPSAIAWHHDPVGRAMLIGTKGFAEADTFGLKLRHLLTPRPGHPIKALAAFADQTLGKFPLDNENTAARLGALGSLGFLFLLAASLFRVRLVRADTDRFCINALASLSLASVMLATIGGFGSIFNFLVSPEIRCYNRISVFIAFFSFVALAQLFRLFELRVNALVGSLICAVLLILGIYDQASFDYIRSMHNTSAVRYDSTRSFVEVIERQMPKGARIYQLPYMPYPNTPMVANMPSHTHLLAYVASQDLSWSWPALSGPAVTFNTNLSKCSPREFVENLVKFDFAGIWINCSGYADGGLSVIQDLETVVGAKHISSPDGEYAFINLIKSQIINGLLVRGNNDYSELVNHMVNISFGASADFSAHGRSSRYLGRGWSDQEKEFRWTDGRQADLVFTFSNPPKADVLLTTKAFALITDSHPRLEVEILANDVPVSRWSFGSDNKGLPFTCRIPYGVFHDGAGLRLSFLIAAPVSPKALGISADQRSLGIAVQELRFDIVQE